MLTDNLARTVATEEMAGLQQDREVQLMVQMDTMVVKQLELAVMLTEGVWP